MVFKIIRKALKSGPLDDVDFDFRISKVSDTFLEVPVFQDLLPHKIFFKERGLFETIGSIGFTIEVSPLVFANETIQEEMHALIKTLAIDEASCQFLLFANPFIDGVFDTWATPRGKAAPIFKKIAAKKKLFFQKEVLGTSPIVPVPPRDFVLFFSFSVPKGDPKDREFLLRKVEQLKTKAISTFSRISHLNEVLPVHLVQILTELTSLDKTTKSPAPKSITGRKFLNEEVAALGALEVTPRGLVRTIKDQMVFKSFQVTEFPENWKLSYNSELIGDFLDPSYRINTPFFIHYGIHYSNRKKHELDLKTKAALLRKQFRIMGILRKNPDLIKESEEYDRCFRTVDSGEGFVKIKLNVGLYAPIEQVTEATSNLLALYKKYRFNLQENHFFHLNELISALPMTWGEPYRIPQLGKAQMTKLTLTNEPPLFLPLLGEWKGNSLDGMPLIGRRGQIAFWDPFVSSSNYNGVVVGASGSGKTVFLEELIVNQMAVGGRVFVLDLGRSFEKLCQLLDGQYLFFTKESNLNLNPFSFLKVDGNTETLDTKLNMVSSIIATMAMPMEKIDGDRLNILNKCVRAAWEREKDAATVDTVISILKKVRYESELMKGASESLVDRLYPFSTNGEYKNFFYGEHTLNFSSNFVVIETEELKNMGDLQAVILQIFSLMISSEVFMGNREQRNLICIDEAWDLLKSPQMESFIESMARRLRKYNGSLFVGTQGLKDFKVSPGAAAAFKNSNWLIMLGRDTDSINVIRESKIFEVTDGIAQILASMKQGRGFSELFMHDKSTGGFALAQLRLDPYSLLLFSTKPEEFGPIMELKKHGVSIEAALQWMLENAAQIKKLREEGVSFNKVIEQAYQLKKKQ